MQCYCIDIECYMFLKLCNVNCFKHFAFNFTKYVIQYYHIVTSNKEALINWTIGQLIFRFSLYKKNIIKTVDKVT